MLEHLRTIKNSGARRALLVSLVVPGMFGLTIAGAVLSALEAALKEVRIMARDTRRMIEGAW